MKLLTLYVALLADPYAGQQDLNGEVLEKLIAQDRLEDHYAALRRDAQLKEEAEIDRLKRMNAPLSAFPKTSVPLRSRLMKLKLFRSGEKRK